jgi:hypothetical protein
MRLLRPLRDRDFALLWTGLTVSLLGDGIYVVAIAWQAYALSNTPAALALVGLCWSGGMIVFLLVGGIVSDRRERRRVMIGADGVRLVVLAVIGVLSLTGALELWLLAVLVTVYGAAEAFFGPAFGALVPDIVAPGLLIEANALDQVIRPLAFRMLGPALGGVLVTLAGAGSAFLVDAGTFAVSAACLWFVRVPPHRRLTSVSAYAALREGLAFVRAHTWLWATLLAASIAMLVFYGPTEVLVPYVVKNHLHGQAQDLGLVLAAGGVGSIAGSIVSARRGLPRRAVRAMYLWWGFGTFPLCLYGLASATWQLMALSLVFGGCLAVGLVTWMTLMQTRVPVALRGRVTSLDWFVSIGLTPVSFALTAPIADAVGAKTTLIGAGLIGGLSTLLILLVVPGLRADAEPPLVDRLGVGVATPVRALSENRPASPDP